MSDRFIDLVKQFAEPCSPKDACPTDLHPGEAGCWTHSWWLDEETGIEGWALMAARWRAEPGWTDTKPFEGSEIRGKAPNIDWGMELRPRGFGYWASTHGELVG